jgi:hypothetical protein
MQSLLITLHKAHDESSKGGGEDDELLQPRGAAGARMRRFSVADRRDSPTHSVKSHEEREECG